MFDRAEARMVQHAVPAEAAGRIRVAVRRRRAASARACGKARRQATIAAWFARAVDLIRPRTRLLADFTTWARAFFTDDFDYEAEAREKFWKDERLPGMLEKLAGCAGGAAGVEPRRLRCGFARRGGGRGRESGSADQRHARGDRGPGCGSAVIRHDGGARPAARGCATAAGIAFGSAELIAGPACKERRGPSRVLGFSLCVPGLKTGASTTRSRSWPRIACRLRGEISELTGLAVFPAAATFSSTFSGIFTGGKQADRLQA